MSDQQAEGFVDYVSSFDLSTLKAIARFMKYLASFYQPALNAYNTLVRDAE
jgi:hypothetical protein